MSDDDLKPGQILRLHAEGTIPASSWTLKRGDEVIAAGEFSDPATCGECGHPLRHHWDAGCSRCDCCKLSYAELEYRATLAEP